ncbi:MAG: homocysteine S-methyltransferase family protein, partial [Bacteroidales bacterium]|nr:homocysteine S-methyltransferase family protein [Bacteroidales bacterium]
MATRLREILSERILVLDGAMGTMLQQQGLRGNNDEFSLTRPEVIQDIHRSYLEAGADIITTNTFSAQRVSQHEYGLTDRIADLNRASVRLARRLADEFTLRDASKPRFVAGCVGPTSKMLSMSENADDPAARSITFDELESAYQEQIQVLVDEGVDIVLIETIFDTLNAKAAVSAYLKVIEDRPEESRPEIMLSMTVSDASGRTLSGQTVAAFVTSVLHARPLALGLNCGLGASGLLPWLRQMSEVAPCFVSCHPNAGLPNQDGEYDQSPEEYVAEMSAFLSEGLVNIVGGCCGTTPQHIRALAGYMEQHPVTGVRRPADPEEATRIAGLEAYSYRSNHFINVGERCNVAGSRKFLRLINEKNYDEALEIARKQVEDGADVVDVNMDDGLLDAGHEMSTFLNLLASDPEVARVPVMIDSSRFEVIEAGLKCLQGKGIVNSISLKMGEQEFLDHARVVKRLGAAIIVMCFDEEGQATDYDRRVRISQRAYRLLTGQVGFAPQDIIFDPNVLTIATGMAEHNDYAADFIRATRWIHDNLPGTRVSGGLSNLSFAFRGNNVLRESMHSVFLHLAIPQGMNMAILNPAAKLPYESIPVALRLAIMECILNTSPD